MTYTLRSNTIANNAIVQLNRGTASASQATERLSSGLRINRASDDSASLALATESNRDARVYDQGTRNINNVISLITLATSAMKTLREDRQRDLEYGDYLYACSYGTFNTPTTYTATISGS